MTGVELEDILSELFPSDDPLDQKDFDVNQYINSLFPNEQSLNGLEDVILEMTNRIDDLDGEVSNLVREGNQNSFESENLLNQSMEEIKELVKSINTIKTRAQVGFSIVPTARDFQIFVGTVAVRDLKIFLGSGPVGSQVLKFFSVFLNFAETNRFRSVNPCLQAGYLHFQSLKNRKRNLKEWYPK